LLNVSEGVKEMELLRRTLEDIGPLNQEALDLAQKRLDNLAVPPGSLGKIGKVGVQLAGITGKFPPELPKKAIILMAGDHGVVSEGVSAFPQEVTQQMVYNFAKGGATINAFARHAGADLVLVDVGVAADLPDLPGLLKRKVAYGTKNMLYGPAMTREEAIEALEVGIEVAQGKIKEGITLLGLGDMGIGNTTPSSALISFFGKLPVDKVTGPGTGLSSDGLINKIKVIEDAIQVNKPDKEDAIDVLAKIGGLEIAGLAGVTLGAAAAGVPVIFDGLISTAAVLTACQICPEVRSYLIGSHLSMEPGHHYMLQFLEIQPMLVLDMRLGEGTGGALTMLMVEAGIKALREVATFDDAQVSKGENSD